MKKEFILSLTSLIFMVLFTIGTTFLYFKKKSTYNNIFQTDTKGIQIAFDDFTSILNTVENLGKYESKEIDTIKLYAKINNIETEQKLSIIFTTNNALETEFKDKKVTYQILDSNNNILVAETPLDYLKTHELYEESITKFNEKITYIIKIFIYENNAEVYYIKGNSIINSLSAEIK